MRTYKDGDYVYYPSRGNTIYQVNDKQDCSTPYPIIVAGDGLTSDGRFLDSDIKPAIFPATEENRAALSLLYGEEFDKPTSPNQLALRNALGNGNFVACLVSHACKKPYSIVKLIKAVHTDGTYIDINGEHWEYVTALALHSDRLEDK